MMNSKIVFRSSALQQQPRRAVNQQQQQSSGSGEFQPRRSGQPDQDGGAGHQPGRPGAGPTQAM